MKHFSFFSFFLVTTAFLSCSAREKQDQGLASLMLDTTMTTPAQTLSADWKHQAKQIFATHSSYLKSVVNAGETDPVHKQEFNHLFNYQRHWFDITLSHTQTQADPAYTTAMSRAMQIQNLAIAMHQADQLLTQKTPHLSSAVVAQLRLTLLYELNAHMQAGRLSTTALEPLVDMTIHNVGIRAQGLARRTQRSDAEIISQLQTRIAELQNKLTEQAQQTVQMIHEHANTRVELATSHTELAQTHAQLVVNHVHLTTAKKDLQQAHVRIEDRNKKVITGEIEVKKLSQQLEQSVEKYKDVYNEYANVQNHVKALHTDLEQERQRSLAIEAELSGAHERMEAMNQRYESYRQETDETHDHMIESLKHLLEQRQGLEEQTRSAKHDVKKLRRLVAASRNEYNKLGQHMAAREKALRSTIGHLESELETLQNEFTVQLTVASLGAQVEKDDLETRKVAFENDKKMMRRRLVKLTEELEEELEKHERRKAMLDEEKQRLDSLEKRILGVAQNTSRKLLQRPLGLHLHQLPLEEHVKYEDMERETKQRLKEGRKQMHDQFHEQPPLTDLYLAEDIVLMDDVAMPDPEDYSPVEADEIEFNFDADVYADEFLGD